MIKLDPNTATQIRHFRDHGLTVRQIADAHRMSLTAIYDVINRHSWRHAT